jgi:protoheme IX farnesyltransferase
VVAIALGRARPADYLELTKPRIVVLVMVTVAAGFYLGGVGAVTGLVLFHTLLATAMVAGGTNALNQVVERDVDARMHRTRGRPLPTGRLSFAEASLFAWALGVGGIAYMALFVNPVASALAAATLVAYVFAYTPLKRRTSLATLVGAIPGALPIAGGWAAATGALPLEAWVLFAIVFLWQLPHFLALAWVYRDDYARAGLKMLSVTDDGESTFRQAVLYAVAMLPVTLAPSVLGLAGPWYFFGALGLTVWLIATALSAARNRSIPHARRLFMATVLWLPAVLALMVLDKTI